jgi:hypothetical protein
VYNQHGYFAGIGEFAAHAFVEDAPCPVVVARLDNNYIGIPF